MYAIIGALIVGLLFGAGGARKYDAGQTAIKEREQVAAQAEQARIAQEERAAAQKQLDAAIRAYEKAAIEAAAKEKIIYAKAQDYAANTPVLRDPKCALPIDGVRLLNSAFAGVRSTADTSGTAQTMSFGTPVAGSPAAGGGVVSGNVPASPRPVDGVHPNARQAGSSGGVPDGHVRANPKPVPINK